MYNLRRVDIIWRHSFHIFLLYTFLFSPYNILRPNVSTTFLNNFKFLTNYHLFWLINWHNQSSLKITSWLMGYCNYNYNHKIIWQQSTTIIQYSLAFYCYESSYQSKVTSKSFHNLISKPCKPLWPFFLSFPTPPKWANKLFLLAILFYNDLRKYKHSDNTLGKSS